MRRTSLCLPILIIVLLLLPAGARAQDGEYVIPQKSDWYDTVYCRAGEILEITISARAAHIHDGNDIDQLGFDFYIERYDGVIFSRHDVRSLTFRQSIEHNVFLQIFISNPHHFYNLVVQVSIRIALIRDVILTNLMILSVLTIVGVFVLRGIKRSQWWKYRAITVIQTLQVSV
jgi:hypothetical protein